MVVLLQVRGACLSKSNQYPKFKGRYNSLIIDHKRNCYW